MKNIENKKQQCIVTITDGISPTSMPFNEFVCYRLKNKPEEKQVVIQLFEQGVDKNVVIPENVAFHSCGMNVYALNRLVAQLERKYSIKAFHIHEGKSVILFSLATMLSKRKRMVYTIHSTYRNYPFHNKLFCSIASLLAYKVTCVSETSYKYFPKILKSLRGGNVSSLQNGVDIERIENIHSDILLSNSDGNFIITYVARLVPLKRHSFLLDVIKLTKNTTLNLIGIGPLEDTLKRQVEELNIKDKVNFLGLLPREMVYQHLIYSNLYVSTSSYEGLPIGVLEAMGCKTMCLVSDIEQHEEIRVHCPSLMTLPTDVDKWVSKINELQQLDNKSKDAIREANRKGVEEHFSLRSMHANYDNIYNQLYSSNLM